MTRPDYAPGQTWTYRTRPGEEDSRLMIRQIDKEPEHGEVFHLSIVGVKMRNHRLPGGVQPAMHHVAVARATLDRTVLEMIGPADTSERWRDGYAVWRQAYENGDVDLFETDVKDILGYVEQVVASSGEIH